MLPRLLNKLPILLLLAAPAWAERPPGVAPGPLAPWWEDARVPGSSALCCGVADGRLVQAKPDGLGGWLVLLDGSWQRVPPENVLEGYPPHPSGSAAVWVYQGGIRCFVPPVAGG